MNHNILVLRALALLHLNVRQRLAVECLGIPRVALQRLKRKEMSAAFPVHTACERAVL